MKHSFRIKVTTIIILIVSCIIMLTWAINIAGLEHFYRWKKIVEIEKAYNDVDAIIKSLEQDNDGSVIGQADNELYEIVRDYSDSYNITMAIIDSSTNTALVSSERDGDKLLGRMQSYLFSDNEKDKANVIIKNDNYQIINRYLSDVDSNFIECVGYCSDNQTVIIMSTPVENMRMNVTLSNRFLGYAGLIALILGIIAVFILTGKVTKPILKLSALSKKMGSLDFGSRYEGQTDDEVGILGSNMNAMADKLEETISQLKNANLELKADIKKKEEIDTMRRDFIANVSHELKTPIALIQGYAEGLNDGMCEDEENRKYYTGVIMDEADKMNKMVKQLLTLSSLESGEQNIQLEKVNITALIKGVIDTTSILLEDKNTEIEFDNSQEIYAWCDEYKIEEVVTNYVSNAIHHVSDGGHIEISMDRHDEVVTVQVFNTGMPIPEEDIGHIWDKFYKVDKAHSRAYGGTGIGLSIVKAIMDAHGMKCGVDNVETGVIFWFELDCKDI